ncbi:MAG: sugar-binding protein [Kiritimatiellae bacterium]|nr:sugar-binding protein [Kiritimatiellia bacterium]
MPMKPPRRLLFLVFTLMVLSARGETPAGWQALNASSPTLRVDRIEYGEWLPLRTQPTVSSATYQHSASLSPWNARQAREMLAGLERKKPMCLVRGPFGRLLVGCDDGLIQGMRPRLLAASFQGSYLREHAPEWAPTGRVDVAEQSAERVVLLWQAGDRSRRIAIHAGGLVETAWTRGPREVRMYLGGHPYHYLAADGQAPVRFSQLLQRRRTLEPAARLALFGYRGASVEVKCDGVAARNEEIWLDSGELGWEWVVAYAQQHPEEQRHERPFGEYMARHGALTYLAGGAIRRLDFAATREAFRVDFRIGERGAACLDDVARPAFAPAAPAGPAPGPVRVLSEQSYTTRLWPNAFNGWELRPVKLARVNPLPGVYELALRNDGATGRVFAFALEKADWMESALVESDPQPVKGPGTVLRYRQQAFWDGAAPAVAVPAGGETTVWLRVKPVEDSLGDYAFTLTWSSDGADGALPLGLRVSVNILVDPYGSGGVLAPADMRRFGLLDWGYHPVYFGMYHPDFSREEVDAYLRAVGEQGVRRGAWTRDNAFLRQYIEVNTGHQPAADAGQRAYFRRPPDEFVKRLREDLTLRPSCVPYRARVYLGDEMWEILGGYKGRRYMPVEEVARWVGDLIRDSPNPCWFSFMQPGVDDQYQCRLPNDIAELFYYCGRDEGVHEYVDKLVRPRAELFERWKRDPELLRRAGTDRPRAIHSFWISGQLHVTDYSAMRRQHWYTRFHGIDSILMWRLSPAGMLYANRIGCNALLAAGNGPGSMLMTDRSLAWHDLFEDMALITLVRFLKERPDAADVSQLEQAAYAASQSNAWDLARHHLATAVRTLDPTVVPLAGGDFYQPITTEALPDLREDDARMQPAVPRRQVAAHKLKGGFRPPPTLDGEVDNAYLEEGVTLGDFVLLDSHAKPKAPTTAYLAWDDTNLYVLVDCVEPHMDRRIARPDLPRDGSVWDSDCVDLLIDRRLDGVSRMHFIVGAGGEWYDSRSEVREVEGRKTTVTETREWDPEWQRVVREKPNGWSVEIAIPLSVLGGAPQPGDTWGFNIGRERVPLRELSTWSPQHESFPDPAQFGRVTFQ